MHFLVIGEICHDIRRECDVERICPEAPVPVLKSDGICYTSRGMAANVEENVRSLGETAQLMSQTSPVRKIRFIDRKSGYIVIRIDENDTVSSYEKFSVPNFDAFVLTNFAGIIISDYNKGYLSTTDIEHIAKKAAENGIPTFLDTKKKLDSYSKLITVVKINESEYLQQTNPVSFCQNLVVTFGAHGSKWVNHLHQMIEPIKISDVCGAGDTYLAAFAIKYVETRNIPKAMEYGNKAARIAVSRRGIVAVTKKELI